MKKLNNTDTMILYGLLGMATIVIAYILISSSFALILKLGGGYLGYNVPKIMVHIMTVIFILAKVALKDD